MDPSSIPPPSATFPAPISFFPSEPTTNNNHVPPPATAAANPTPAPPPTVPVSAQAPAPGAATTPNHPPYSEMIYAAIEALKEKNGSSKRAIAKYIEQAYRDLPPTHSALLTYHLQRLKNNGLLVMVKKSYKLPRSDGSPSTPQRGRGRPPKLKPQPQTQPLAQAQPEQQLEPAPNAPQNLQNAEPVWVALGLADEPAEVKKRGPGRPRKSGVVEGVGLPGPVVRRGRPPGTGRSRLPKRPGRPPKPKSVLAISNGLKRRPGRPPKIQSKPTVIPFAAPAPTGPAVPTVPTAQATAPDGTVPIMTPRRRGRPKKYAAGLPALGAPPQAFVGRGRGRGRGRGVFRSSTGRPVGRPKKGTTSDSTAQRMVSEDLKRKLEYFQTKVKESLSVIKPHFNHESPVTAIAAIQDLEILATMDLNAPLNDDTQQLQQFPQPQLQPQPQPQPQQQPEFQPQQLPQPHMFQQSLPQPHMFQQPFSQPQIYQQQLPQPQMYQQQLPHVPLQSQQPQLFQPHA